MASDAGPAAIDDRPASPYMVVARRYRPQGFDDLIGQETIAGALRNAIRTHRVGHAYLFTGARGVGKTSTARILAKALNCTQGPTPHPCNACDICQRIATGDDVDVMELDGASNRGIDEIRQLRSNVGIRPSRARYKIFIIDEVHMLTREAFNALLKTLEEPPEHVKFFFCTTDPDKIPVTVLSRCQRFDFPPIGSEQIVERLGAIVRSEGREADPEALRLIARRAAGSVRDSQSLLEQVLAVADERVTTAHVHHVLGIAHSGRLASLVDALCQRDAGRALGELDQAIGEGVDAGPLAGQLVGYLRDLLTLGVGADPALMSTLAEADVARGKEEAIRWGIETLLAALQVLDQALVRMRHSLHPRVLLEIALVRICHLADLDALDALVHAVQGTADQDGKKKGPARPTLPAPLTARQPPPASPPPSPAPRPAGPTPGPPEAPRETPPPAASGPAPSGLAGWDPAELWRRATGQLEGFLADCAGRATSVAIRAPNVVVATFSGDYNSKAFCERPARREAIEAALGALCGRPVRVELQGQEPASRPQAPAVSARELHKEVAAHPWVQQACELLAMEVAEVIPAPRGNTA